MKFVVQFSLFIFFTTIGCKAQQSHLKQWQNNAINKAEQNKPLYQAQAEYENQIKSGVRTIVYEVINPFTSQATALVKQEEEKLKRKKKNTDHYEINKLRENVAGNFWKSKASRIADQLRTKLYQAGYFNLDKSEDEKITAISLACSYLNNHIKSSVGDKLRGMEKLPLIPRTR